MTSRPSAARLSFAMPFWREVSLVALLLGRGSLVCRNLPFDLRNHRRQTAQPG
jgi:hypothetical protein